MKAKTIKVNQRKTQKARNRCTYNECSDSPRCNKVFAVFFIMFIAGMFITSILLAFVKARWIDLSRPTYAVSADNIGNFTLLEFNDIKDQETGEAFEDSKITESINVERFLENLNEVYDSHSFETTTEMSAAQHFHSDEPLLMRRSKKFDMNYNHEDRNNDPDVPETTTVMEQKPCILTDRTQKTCEVTCADIEVRVLSDVLLDLINTELKTDSICESDYIKLKLKNVSFASSEESHPWVQNTRVFITHLTIMESPDIHFINDDSFNSLEFDDMTNLRIDGVGKNELKFNCEHCFVGTSSLKYLTISNFESIDLPGHTFRLLNKTLIELEISKIGTSWNVKDLMSESELTKIEKVFFYQNLFNDEVFMGSTFYGISNSINKEINLASSNIKSLSRDTFMGCSKLERLDLKSNIITDLPAGIFDDLESLKYLYLQNNSLHTLHNGLFDTQIRTKKFNSLNLLNNLWNCDSEILYLKQILNQILQAEDPKCKEPEIHRDKYIRDIWCFLKVDGQKCLMSCEHTDSENFESILEIYNTSRCEFIEMELKSHDFQDDVIPLNWLNNLNFKIHTLTIDNTYIEWINSGSFESQSFDELYALSIKQNKAQSFIIGSDGLNGLNSLEILKIEESDVLTLQGTHNIMQPIGNHLKEICLTSISKPFELKNIFESLTFENLKVLRLSGNNFESVQINENTFKGTHQSVEELYMAYSRITKITPNAFAGFTNLKIINLEGNKLAQIDGRFFGNSANKKFISINLSNSQIDNLTDDSFDGCIELEVLDLSHNSIANLPTRIFDSLINLKDLNLQNNSLNSIVENLFHAQMESEKLEKLNLMDNLWNCNQNVVYLKKFLWESNIEILINGCEEPESLHGHNIKYLWCNVDSCTITCQSTDQNVLVPVLNIFDMTSCSTIELELGHHSFINAVIPENWLSDLIFNPFSISILNSNINSITNTSFMSHVFENLNKLKIKYNNQLSFVINQNGFSGLSSLETLEIDQQNSISTTTQFNILTPIWKTLKYLSITNIKDSFDLSRIFGRSSDIFENIKILNLSGNNFGENVQFNVRTFTSVHENLQEIYLRKSGIRNFTTNAFSGFKKLKFADLRENELKSLNHQFFEENVTDLRILIAGNLWNCTCDLKFLLNFMVDEDEVLCDSPDELEGKNITELESCHDETTTEQTTTTEEETTTPEETTTTSITTTTRETTTTRKTTTTTTSKEDTTTETKPTTTSEITIPNTTTDQTTTKMTTTQPQTTTDKTTEDPEATKTLNGRSTGPTNSPSTFEPMAITCTDLNISSSIEYVFKNGAFDWQSEESPIASQFEIRIPRPIGNFSIKETENKDELEIELGEFYNYYPNFYSFIIYYPSNEYPFAESSAFPKCIIISSKTIIVNKLNIGVIYNFCISFLEQSYFFYTPFQCKPYVLTKGRPWLYEENKVAILTSVSLLIILALILGVVLTYCLIRKIPTIIKGSKRVVLVNNRTSDVMILPRNSTQSICSSIRKESVTPIRNEPPTYLTPLPRQSIDQRPPFVRSSSDTSLKSYVSVSRLPPRFSQVYQRDDFESCSALRHNGGYPFYPPSAPCQASSEIPPPLPRRSIVSTASSTQQSCASTVELGRTLSRACNHNSTYRRHQRPLEIEQENHYNIII